MRGVKSFERQNDRKNDREAAVRRWGRKNANLRKFLLHFVKRCGMITKLSMRHAPLAQLDRASGYGPEGRGFESLTACQKSSKSYDFEDFCFL